MAGKKSGGSRRATLKDVAELAGVSINTCSAVLNPRSVRIPVSVETRRKVHQAAKQVNYQRNVAASTLAGGSAKTLGILLDRIDNFFWGPVLSAFETEAVARGYQCLIGCTHYEGPRRLECLKRFVEHGVDGLLLTTIWDDPGVEEAMAWAPGTGPAVVFVDFPLPDYPAPLVCGDHFQGGMLLARHLIDEGHRSLAFLCPKKRRQHGSVKDRIRGVRSAIRNGPQDMKSLQIAVAESEDRAALTRVVLDRMNSATAPTAIIAVNDPVAYALLAGLHEAGCRVPQDIAVTGYDDFNNLTLGGMGIPD
jgi:LacI family transcriptional regulator